VYAKSNFTFIVAIMKPCQIFSRSARFPHNAAIPTHSRLVATQCVSLINLEMQFRLGKLFSLLKFIKIESPSFHASVTAVNLSRISNSDRANLCDLIEFAAKFQSLSLSLSLSRAQRQGPRVYRKARLTVSIRNRS